MPWAGVIKDVVTVAIILQLVSHIRRWNYYQREGVTGKRTCQNVRIDNSPSLETQAQEQESNPDPGSPQAAGPMDCGTARPHFFGIKPLQADAKNDGPCSETGQADEILHQVE
ncbi:hypothetical protein DSO57_1025419 [Entomophthora muscae]|uniref:Uncharacterized protein n=1 Tax=Entomophthora muscae TaxID=34485 RepID=A0ACC2T2M6_9FUNG|nr:hypothetical protein DSO57_1025419 [Entomophthora muscae]